MIEFSKYLESNGIKETKDLTGFVNDFLKDPSIFFDLTSAERGAMEKRIDEALKLFKKN